MTSIPVPKLGRYELIGELGRGNMGTVYLGRASPQCRLRFQQVLMRNLIRRLVSLSTKVAESAAV